MMKYRYLWMILTMILALSLVMAACSVPQEEETPGTEDPLQQEQNEPEQDELDQNEPEEEGPWMSDEEWAHLQEYGEYDPEFAFHMPGDHGFESQGWSVGLGLAHEWGLGMPYEFIDRVERPAEDLAAYNWETIVNSYHNGFHAIYMTDLKTKGVMTWEEPSPCFIQYMSTTQPDCKTFRGIHVGNTVKELMEAYPESQAHLDYVNHAAEAEEPTGVMDHDMVWMYLPEADGGANPNRSILFMTKDDVIVQIGISDGLDGQIWNPVWTGEPAVE